MSSVEYWSPLRRGVVVVRVAGLMVTGLFLLLLFSQQLSARQYVVNFEGTGETKTAYASGTVTLSGLDWNMTEALIGTSAADWKNGNRSARLRGYGTTSMTMLDNKADGAGTISFLYRRYETDVQVEHIVEYSINDGVDWLPVGSPFTAPASNDVQTFSHDLNITGDIRIRIRTTASTGTSNRRLNIDDITITDYFEAPKLTTEPATSVLLNSATLNADITATGGLDITLRGFKFSTTPDFDPEDEGTEIAESGTFGTGAFSLEATGLAPGTLYFFRAFAENDEGRTYGGERSFTTASLLLEAFDQPYQQNFSAFTSAATLPAGWTAISSGDVNAYQGDWGSGNAGGLRGNANVLGYQHNASSGIFTATLSIVNNTGATIRTLDVSYLGKVERATQTRFPEWTVTVAGQTVSALAYSTAAGADENRSAIVQGLNIPNGQVFTITWASDRGPGSDASRQIGISDVSVAAIVAPPVLSVEADSGPFFEDQTVFVSNFEDYAATEIRYTLDGTDPDGSSDLYDNSTGIVLADGSGPITLKIKAIQDADIAESGVIEGEYVFPFDIADIEALRQQPTGTAIYRLTNEATLIGQTSFRNTKFFQDDSGFGIQIDDPLVEGQRVINTLYEVGDRVGGFLTGTLNIFEGQLRFRPVIDPGLPVSEGNEVVPVSRTLNSITANDQARLIVVENVEFQSTGQDFPVAGGITAITDPSISGFTGRFRMVFADSDLSDAETKIPSGPQNIVAIVQQNSAGLNIAARNLLDIDPVTKTLSVGNDSDPAPAQQGWRFISSPVPDVPLPVLLAEVRTQGVGPGSSYPNPAADPNVITLNQNQQYVAFTTDFENATLAPGRAVGVYLFDLYSPDQTNPLRDGFPKTFSVSGLQAAGNVAVSAPIPLNTGSGRFSIVGNPFNAAIEFQKLSRQQLAPVVYAYDTAAGFVSYSAEMESGDLADGLLGPFQGFFVQATGASPELIIPESARTTAAADGYFRAPEGHQLRLQLVAELLGEGIPTLRSSLWAGTHPEGGAGDAPSLHDALRLYPLDFRPFLSLYTTAGGRALSIRSLSEEVLTDTGTVLPVWTDAWKPGSGGYVPASGTLSLSWPRLEGLPAGAQLLLEDTQTGTFTDLTQAGSYTFTLGDAASVQAARPLPPAPDFSRAAEGTAAPLICLPAPLTVVADPQTALPDQDPQPRLRLHLLPAPLSTVPPETGGLSLPQQLRLDQNYPNPFNPSTQIRFQLPETAEVRLEVFNIQGQRVALLLRETRPAGTHTVTFDAGPLASGVYLYRLQAGNQVLTRKMTVVK